MINKVKRLFNTLKYLKPIQVFYQFKYRFLPSKNKISVQISPNDEIEVNEMFFWKPSSTKIQRNGLEFLNKSVGFINGGNIPWDFSDYGMLFRYNLGYFECIFDSSITKDQGLYLIKNFINDVDENSPLYDPYPTSLRSVNWIKFFVKNNISDLYLLNGLVRGYEKLLGKLEYHLLANHLFENGVSLFIGGVYLNNSILLDKGIQILTKELKEQVLSDGAHYELSPSYHYLLTYRLLDCIAFAEGSSIDISDDFESLLRSRAELMMGFARNIRFGNSIPHLNDSAPEIYPDLKVLNDYSNQLRINPKQNVLGESGFRILRDENFELLFNLTQISPSYQPGHAHADSLSVLLNYKGLPILVDTGVSTYEKNERRLFERSTAAHNTVCLDNQNSSDVWGGFRVGRRANTIIEEVISNSILAKHDGYRHLKAVHQRKVEIGNNQAIITDWITENVNVACKANFVFSESLDLSIRGNCVTLSNGLEFVFEGSVEIVEYDIQVSKGFNFLVDTKKLEVSFLGFLKTVIKS